MDIEFIYNVADFSQYRLKIQVLVILSSRCVNIYVERLFSQAICNLKNVILQLGPAFTYI